MSNKQLNLSFKPDEYKIITKGYKIMLRDMLATPSLNEWSRGELLKRSKRIILRDK